MKTFLITFSIIALCLLTYIFYNQEVQLSDYKARETALIFSEANQALRDRQVADSVSASKDSVISKINADALTMLIDKTKLQCEIKFHKIEIDKMQIAIDSLILEIDFITSIPCPDRDLLGNFEIQDNIDD